VHITALSILPVMTDDTENYKPPPEGHMDLEAVYIIQMYLLRTREI
jgi:hypothetical protein